MDMSTYNEHISKRGTLITKGGKYISKGRGLYTPAQITSMIATEQYIPVATAAELNGLRNATTRTMGAGTIWEGNYLTGLDKKYVQVRDIDASLYTATSGFFTGVFDGNLFVIESLTVALFTTIQNQSEIRNVKINNATLTGVGVGFICNTKSGTSGGLIEKCHIAGFYNPISYNVSGQFGGIVGNVASSGFTIRFCTAYLTISGSQFNTGGLVGSNLNGANLVIENCYSNIKANSIFTGTKVVGGIIGHIRASCTVNDCGSNMVAEFITGTGARYIGGIAGYQETAGSTINRCFTDVDLYSDSTSGYNCLGGIAGLNRNANSINDSISKCKLQNLGTATRLAAGIVPDNANSFVNNCYAIPILITAVTRSGISGGGTVVNSYYDSTVWGITSGLGLPRTTAQLKNGTASSFINPDGTIDGTNNSANAMFTAWDNNIWRFNPTSKYPRLRNVS
jgi:hypothetical protein